MDPVENLERSPWGWASGLLAGAVSTLVGIACGLEPDVILYRAALAGLVVGTAISLIVRVGLVLRQDGP